MFLPTDPAFWTHIPDNYRYYCFHTLVITIYRWALLPCTTYLLTINSIDDIHNIFKILDWPWPRNDLDPHIYIPAPQVQKLRGRLIFGLKINIYRRGGALFNHQIWKIWYFTNKIRILTETTFHPKVSQCMWCLTLSTTQTCSSWP